MARIRTIKPEFFTSLTIADLPLEARLTFIGLWTHVDDEGRCVDDARLVKAAVWPLDDRTAGDVEKDVQLLSEASLITQYKVGGRSYLTVNSWGEHQRINRPTRSKVPGPEMADEIAGIPVTHIGGKAATSSDEEAQSDHASFSEDSVSHHGGLTGGKEQGTGNREQGKEQGEEADASSSSETAPPPRDDVERVCAHLADRVEANGSKRPTIGQAWRDAARLLMDKDGRTEDQVLKAIDWCQADEFWRSNVMSMPTLRKQFDRLRLAAQRQPSNVVALRGSDLDQKHQMLARARARAAEMDALEGRA